MERINYPHRRQSAKECFDLSHESRNKYSDKTEYIRSLQKNMRLNSPDTFFGFSHGLTSTLASMIYSEENGPLFKIYYTISIEGDDITLNLLDQNSKDFDEHQVLFTWKDGFKLTVDEISPKIIKEIEKNFSAQIKNNNFLQEKIKKFNIILDQLSLECNVEKLPVLLDEITMKEIVNGEIKVKFKIKDEIFEELIDLNVKQENIYFLKEMLQIKSVLNNENIIQKTNKQKRI